MTIYYSIVPKDLAGHVFKVTLQVAQPDPQGQEFKLPAWIPGSYLVREFARHIVQIRASSNGKKIALTKRGIYGGACGYLSFSGAMDLAIAIRTGVLKDGMLYVQAAAGIVADSVPETEWQETENKARAVLRAAEQVQDGLDGEI